MSQAPPPPRAANSPGPGQEMPATLAAGTYPCPQCGATLAFVSESPSQGAGCVVGLVGLLFAFFESIGDTPTHEPANR